MLESPFCGVTAYGNSRQRNPNGRLPSSSIKRLSEPAEACWTMGHLQWWIKLMKVCQANEREGKQQGTSRQVHLCSQTKPQASFCFVLFFHPSSAGQRRALLLQIPQRAMFTMRRRPACSLHKAHANTVQTTDNCWFLMFGKKELNNCWLGI